MEVDLVAEMAVYNPFNFFLEPDAEHVSFQYDPALAHELEPFQRCCELSPPLAAMVSDAKAKIAEGKALRTIDFLV